MAQYHVDKMAENVYILRVDDAETRYFEALWEIPEGITYNAYLVLGDEKRVLIDGWKKNYAPQLLETISSIIEPKTLDYIVVNHMEPDHTGTLPTLVEAAPNAQIVAHPLAAKMADSFYGIKGNIKPVRDGQELDIGGKKLSFHYTPWLHWPETMMTLLTPENTLFSCDAFGGYSIPPTIYDDNPQVVEKYLPFATKYLFTVIGGYMQHITKNLEKLAGRGVNPATVAPAHGLVFRRNPSTIIEHYRKLAAGHVQKGKVTIIYDSMYGFIEQQVAEATVQLQAKGINPTVHRIVDTEHPHLSDIVGDAGDSEALIIGASTYESGVFPHMDYVTDIITKKVKHPKKILVLSSYGWGGVAGKKIAKKLETAGHKIVDIIEIKGQLTQEDREKIRDAVSRLLS